MEVWRAKRAAKCRGGGMGTEAEESRQEQRREGECSYVK